jgi:hypothetical protein
MYVCLKKKAEELDNLEKEGPEDKKRYLVCMGLYTMLF